MFEFSLLHPPVLSFPTGWKIIQTYTKEGRKERSKYNWIEVVSFLAGHRPRAEREVLGLVHHQLQAIGQARGQSGGVHQVSWKSYLDGPSIVNNESELHCCTCLYIKSFLQELRWPIPGHQHHGDEAAGEQGLADAQEPRLAWGRTLKYFFQAVQWRLCQCAIELGRAAFT